ncbi:MAG: hypothetical protein KKD39_07495 [Candidatus Altiarchaeota archaeon]|nr:hypothetical protein [Candidatus Altiarchaeota archaeon]
MILYKLIDRVPEMPYFMMALAYSHLEVEKALHTFSASFLFLLLSILVGLFLKTLLKTKRPVEYPCIPVARYDIPSLHTLISVGAIPLIYFLDSKYAFFFVPLALVYMYSRLKLGFHSKKAVYLGALAGLVVGVVSGFVLSKMVFGLNESIFLTVSFFMLPLAATVFRLKYIRLSVIVFHRQKDG